MGQSVIRNIRRFVSLPGGGAGNIQSIVAGTNITIDNTDPLNPIINGVDQKPIVVTNYSALPAANTVTGKFYWCSNSQGVPYTPDWFFGTYYSKGLYYSNGITWEYLPVPYQATQAEVDIGTNTDKFVTSSTFTNASKWTTKEDVANKSDSATGAATDSVGYFSRKGVYNFVVSNFGTLLFGYWNGLFTSKITPVDADTITIVNSQDSGKAWKMSLSDFWTNYIKGKSDAIYQASLGYTPENVANKATDYTVINNTKYPTTQATEDRYQIKQNYTNIFLFMGA